MHIQDMTWANQEHKSTLQNTNTFNFNSEQEKETADMLTKWQIFIKDNTKITSRFKRQENDIVRHNRQMNGRVIEFRKLTCWGRPKIRKSVFEGLTARKLDTLAIVFSRWVLLWDKSTAENYRKSWVSSA